MTRRVRRSLAYFGTYTVDEEGGTFTIRVEDSLMPNWVGTALVVAIDGGLSGGRQWSVQRDDWKQMSDFFSAE